MKENNCRKPIATGPQCIPCLVRAGVEMICRCLDCPQDSQKAIRRLLQLISQSDFDLTPVEISDDFNRMIRRESGVFDPYLEVKRERNQRALRMLPAVRKRVEDCPDVLLGALLAAAAGNIMDQVAGDPLKAEEALEDAFNTGFAVDSCNEFRQCLSKAQSVLYIGDNSGEIVFDRILAEQIHRQGKNITFCVRGGPAVDDALEEDWRTAGLSEFTSLVTTGSTALGCPQNRVGKEFHRAFEKADMIIAKGMGNYETLGHLEDPRLFLLLKAKCPAVADNLGVKVGHLCLYHALDHKQ